MNSQSLHARCPLHLARALADTLPPLPVCTAFPMNHDLGSSENFITSNRALEEPLTRNRRSDPGVESGGDGHMLIVKKVYEMLRYHVLRECLQLEMVYQEFCMHFLLLL